MSLTVKFYDVEHGSCTHIITPNGKHFLVDIGTKSGKSICQHIKNNHLSYGERIDYLIITHPHIDHIADLENLYTYDITPRVLWRDKDAFPLQIVATDSATQVALKRKANAMSDYYTSTVADYESPSNTLYNGGVELDLFPASVSMHEKDDLNYFSCVVVLRYGGFKIVLTGDNPSAKLIDMLGNSSFKSAVANATLLLAPHHGRDSDYCDDFVRAVNPRLTVFSDKAIQHETQAHATQKYYTHTRGVNWNGGDRYILTTRSDGTITFKFKDDGNWSIDTSSTEY
jgi:competence protein ComEC